MSKRYPFGRLQWVWWGLPWYTVIEDGCREWHWGWWAWGFERIPPESSWSMLYVWRLRLGPLDIRRLSPSLAEG